MPAFALYRLPYQQHCHMVMQKTGQPMELTSVFALSGLHGFVVAPFTPDESHPVLLINNDISAETEPEVWLPDGDGKYAELRAQMEQILDNAQQRLSVKAGSKTHYMIDFANFHSQIAAGHFSKIVLARCYHEPNLVGESPLTLFVKACHLYPRLMVSLVAAPRCGAWLVASPEVLLESDDDFWTTMSLAGTMRLSDDQLSFDEPPSPMGHDEGEITWSIKNIQEQRFVSTYITESLEQVATDIEEHGPYTMRAGKLVHLRSDFRFTIADTRRLGELLYVLYPTPAVCGLPKDAARDFIRKNEYAPREYYSGFMGMLNPEGETHLYVSLRCMRINRDGFSLYAGGGLLPDSNLETEWDETEDKMDTMRALI
ncbi:MAG: chorismate-binding protein [Prevotella sp.]|nr:chorismate-binding protein [Prevotella sp.]